MGSRIRFDRFTVDTREGRLYDGSDPVHLQPKAYALLVLLATHPGELFSREDLQAQLWPDVRVTDESLSKLVSRLRKALKGCSAVTTVPRRGYRFVGEVKEDNEPSAAAPPPAHRVPPPPELVGRTGALAEVAAALKTSNVVVLHGAAGVGKTAVARAACAAWSGEAVEAGEGLAAALGLPPGIDSDGLAAALRARPGLLVHVDDPSADQEGMLRQLHRAAPQVHWLLSCRTLPTWTGQRVVPLQGLAPADAVALLGRPAEDDAAAWLRLAAALDHLPLALELAAPLLRHVSPATLLEQLSDRFEVLEGSSGSLRATIQAAWDQRTPIEQAGLMRLATSSTPVPLDGALAMLEGLEDFPLDLLQRLVDATWLRVSRTGTESTVVVPPNLAAWTRAHGDEGHRAPALLLLARWLWTDTAPAAQRAGSSAEATSWAIVLERTPLAVALAGDPRVPFPERAQLARLATIAARIEGPSADRLALLQTVLTDGHGQIPTVLAVHLACARNGMIRQLQRGEAAVDASHDTVALAEATGDPAAMLEAWRSLAMDLVAVRRYAEAEAAVHRCQAIADATGDPVDAAAALFAAAVTYRFDPQEAGALRQLLSLPIDPRDWTRLQALTNLAIAAHDAGRWHEAEARYRERLAVPGIVDPPHLRVPVVIHLANLLATRDRFAEADPLFGQATAAAQQGGQGPLELQAQLDWAAAEVGAGRVRQAQRRLAAVLGRSPPSRVQIHAHTILGAAALRDARPEDAISALQIAIRGADEAGSPALAEDARLLLAGARALSGDVEGAERDLRGAATPGDVPPFVAGATWWVRALVDPLCRPSAIAALQAPGPGDSPSLLERVSDLRWMLSLLR